MRLFKESRPKSLTIVLETFRNSNPFRLPSLTIPSSVILLYRAQLRWNWFPRSHLRLLLFSKPTNCTAIETTTRNRWKPEKSGDFAQVPEKGSVTGPQDPRNG